MNLLTLLDVILGVFFVYLIFSLVTSAINEGIAAMLGSRAKWLRNGMRSLFGQSKERRKEEGKDHFDAKTTANDKDEPRVEESVDAFYRNPFISYLNNASGWQFKGVSYAPARSVLKALLTYSRGSVKTAESLKEVFEKVLEYYPRNSLGLSGAIAALKAVDLRSTLQAHYDAVNGDVDAFVGGLETATRTFDEARSKKASEECCELLGRLTNEIPETWSALRASVANLPEGSPIRVVLTDLMVSAQGDLQALSQKFDEWYATFEAQVTAWYRQKTHLVLAVIAVVLSLAMNIDSLALVRQLSGDADLRTKLAQQALERTQQEGPAAAQRKSRDAAWVTYERQRDEVPLTAEGDDAKAAKAVAETEADSAYGAYLQAQQAYEQSLKSEVQALERAGLNFGWEPAWFNSLWARFHADWSGALLTLLMKLSGLLVTAAALTLGAPFWFDQLQKIAQIRSVGLSLVERRTAENKQQATAAAKD